ncbi:MAG: ImmA/IrrE family metallo-endopeptidase [Thermodesulfobacteriota bacterium]
MGKLYEVLANNLLHNAWGDRGFPIDPVTICTRLGIKVIQTTLPADVSGALIKEQGKDPVILVHQADSRKRQRFTCAHELGHYVHRASCGEALDEYDTIDLRDPLSKQGTDPVERYANNFAANLLMPFHEVGRLHRAGTSLFDMADYFDVSEEAMSFRLQYVTKRLPAARLFGERAMRLKNTLAGVGSILDIAPSSDYTRLVPRLTVQQRLRANWEKVGSSIRKSVIDFEHERQDKAKGK